MAVISVSSLGGNVGGLARSSLSYARRHWISLGVGFLITLALAALAAILYSNSHQTPGTGLSHKYPKFSAAKTANDKAISYANAGDYATGQKLLDDEAAAAGSPAEKAQVYISQASLAFNKPDYAQAKSYAQKAETAQPSDVSAVLLGDIALKQKDNSGARTYYQKAIDRLKPNTPDYPGKYREYQAKLQAAGK